MPRKAFRIKRQNGEGETLHPPNHNLCRCCYRQLTTPTAAYCGTRCHTAHQRLHGTT